MTDNKIGKGSFGIVYKQIKDDVMIAEKHTLMFENDIFIRENLREAVFLSGFPKNTHTIDCISIHLYEHSKQDTIVIQMPYIKETLSKWINETSKDKRVKHFKKICYQLCLSLAAIHDNILHHGDIKPSNIMIDPDDVNVKIIDFSSVKFENNQKINQSCTLIYRSPEMFKEFNKSNTKPFGPHNDVWSLGVVMLELLTGENRLASLCNTDDTHEMNSKKVGAFVNRIKPFPVDRLLTESGFSLKDEDIELFYSPLLKNMLQRDIQSRKTILDILNHLSFEPIPKIIAYKDTINILKNIDMSRRKKAIIAMKNLFSQPKTQFILYYLPLAISIFDRYISNLFETLTESEKEKEHYRLVMISSLYISTHLLSDEILTDVLPLIQIYGMHEIKKKCKEIILKLNFDLYRPTIITKLIRKNTIIPPHIATIALDIIQETEDSTTNVDELLKKVDDMEMDIISTPKQHSSLEDKTSSKKNTLNDEIFDSVNTK